jgi:hypothetical protein
MKKNPGGITVVTGRIIQNIETVMISSQYGILRILNIFKINTILSIKTGLSNKSKKTPTINGIIVTAEIMEITLFSKNKIAAR